NSGPLTILSSALAPVEELGPVAGMEVHSTGGRFRLENLDFVGPRAIAMCAGFHVDLAFLGADAFAPGTGAFTTDEWSAAIADALARIAERVVLVVDSSKFGNTARFRVLSVDRIATVLTDSGILREMQAAMAADPYDLIVAAPAREL
ncbi:MAG: DeoR/GlpR transcriptional regulator, partial [Lentisphaerae bacterium]|nr:DeoR/GlpR transcriptional regulator [Lentisphaerota bacterium]